MIAIIFIFTAVWCFTILAAGRIVFRGRYRENTPAPITQKTPGLGSNGECRQERDGLSRDEGAQPRTNGPFAGGLEASRAERFSESLKQPNACTSPTVKTGYEPAEDSHQVPSPLFFAPVPTGLLKCGFLVTQDKSRSGYVGKSHLSPKLARSISLGLLLAIQRSVRKI